VVAPQNLPSLLRAGLILPSEDSQDDEFVFAHTLLQEAAYASLLRYERRELHQAVGEVLEASYPERGEDLAPVLAEHFLHSRNPARALDHLCRAGKAADRLFAVDEASGHFARAFDLLNPTTSDRDRVEEVALGLGRALELQNRFADALRVYDWMEAAGRQRPDDALRLAALVARAKVLGTPNPAQDPARAEQALEEALDLAHRLGDVASESRILWNRMIARVYSGGDVGDAIRMGQASLALARRHGLTEQMAFTLNDLAYGYTALDDPTSALEAQTEAEGLWRSLGNWPMLADCLATSVVSHHMLGELSKARTASEEALAISRKIGNLWGQANSQLYRSYVDFDAGRPDLAFQAAEQTAGLGSQAGHVVAAFVASADRAWMAACLGDVEGGLQRILQLLQAPPPMPQRLIIPHALGILGRIRVRAGDLIGAREAFDQALTIMPDEGLRLMAPFALPVGRAELALAERRPEEGLAVLDTYLTYLEAHRGRVFLPEALFLRGRLLAVKDGLAAAHGDLQEALRMAEEEGILRLVGPVASWLGQVCDAVDRPQEAAAFRSRGREAYQAIASHIPQASLRRSFLATPEVRDVVKG